MVVAMRVLLTLIQAFIAVPWFVASLTATFGVTSTASEETNLFLAWVALTATCMIAVYLLEKCKNPRD